MLRRIIRMTLSSTQTCPTYTGQSGLTYTFRKLIQQRPETGRVWIAECILKDIPESYYLNFTEEIWPRLRTAPNQKSNNIRLPCDTIPNQRVLVYKYLSYDFLDLARRKDIGPLLRRRILKSVLRGLAELHDQDLVHLDIKPDNIVVECHDNILDNKINDVSLDSVQITDIENAVWLKPGKNIFGLLAGNNNWRSPEAHMRSKLNKPTDMFSFGAMCIYAMLGRVIFGRDQDFDYHVSQGIEPGMIPLQRQVCYFGDEAGCMGLRRYVDHDERLCQLVDAMWEDRTAPYIPYKHFATWPEVKDDGFQDVILKLMSLDPEKRLLAREALAHPWFADVDAV